MALKSLGTTALPFNCICKDLHYLREKNHYHFSWPSVGKTERTFHPPEHKVVVVLSLPTWAFSCDIYLQWDIVGEKAALCYLHIIEGNFLL